MSAKNGEWFDIEMDKLDRWAEDRRTSLKADLEELDWAAQKWCKSESFGFSNCAVFVPLCEVFCPDAD
jgi:hypothetical protein